MIWPGVGQRHSSVAPLLTGIVGAGIGTVGFTAVAAVAPAGDETRGGFATASLATGGAVATGDADAAGEVVAVGAAVAGAVAGTGTMGGAAVVATGVVGALPGVAAGLSGTVSKGVTLGVVTGGLFVLAGAVATGTGGFAIASRRKRWPMLNV